MSDSLEKKIKAKVLGEPSPFTYESHSGFPVGVLDVEGKSWEGPTVSHSPACVKAEPAFVYGDKLLLREAQIVHLKLSGVSEQGKPIEVQVTLQGDLMQKDLGLPTALAVSPPSLMGWICSRIGDNEWSVKRPFSPRHLDRADGLELGSGAGKVRVVRDLPREAEFMEKFLSPALIHFNDQSASVSHVIMREYP